MKNPTRHKIEEAEYFLSMMELTFEDDDRFSYNFSAFLSAARSVTFYMQKQYKHRNGFAEWYCRKQIEMSADSELDYLKEARVENIHRETVQTGATHKLTVSLDVIIGSEVTPEKEQVEETAPEPPTQSSYTTVRFFPDLKDGDVIEFCKRQLAKYEELVEECEECFPEQSKK